MNDILELRFALDTFYLLICGALVLWMAAGFTMLEAGLVRAKNTTEILTKNIGLFCIACLMYYLSGYAIMYPANASNAYWPGFATLIPSNLASGEWLAQAERGETSLSYANMADFFFQVVFVATAMSVVSGAVAERMKLWAFFTFSVVMCGLIYPIQGFWKWGGGFLDQAGFVDFAGSGIVHLCGASAALAGIITLGPRMGKYSKNGRINAIPGANLPLAALGTIILWFGWLGFNGGSELAISNIDEANTVALVFVNTTLAAAAGGIAATLTAQLVLKKPDLTMLLNGVLGGLVSITAAPDSPAPWLAIVIGIIGGVLVVLAVLAIDRIKLDDPVGALSVHGVCGIWGLLAVPLSQADASFSVQLLGIGSIAGFVFFTSLICWLILKVTVGIRVAEQVEYDGLDLHECGMHAYPEFMHKA
ncbi:ammonium transporter [Cardiobacteriaceae bacterium TAE3-ERU3]|nr:ammonium transporter [Cardiobacteriaceae bacterium TAE3-ERU3]